METKIAVFGGGCFWCTEAVFQDLRGVISVQSGYAGGETPNPTYESVSSGKTGHAEVIRIEYDPAQISFHDLLTVFFASHDPTTLNQQGNDLGSQYRSLILYTDEEQREESQKYIDKIEGAVTQIKMLDKFYKAEEYHQKYYTHNTDKPYCQIVINPKLEKIQKEYSNLLKSHGKNC